MNSKIAAGLLVGLLMAVRAGAQAPRDDLAHDADKLESAAEQISRMKASMDQVLAQVEEARDEKDVVKLNCGYEKLMQIRALVTVAEQADIALHDAVSNRDPATDTELSKIAIARSKVEGLRGEAEQCIGQLAYVVEEQTTVEVEQPAHLPGSSRGEARLGVALRGQKTSDAVAKTGAGSDAEVAKPPPGQGPPFPLPPPVPPPPASRCR